MDPSPIVTPKVKLALYHKKERVEKKKGEERRKKDAFASSIMQVVCQW